MRVKLKYGKLLSSFAFKSNLRHYIKGPGHSGNFFMEFFNEVMVNNSGVISYSVDGYLVSQDLPEDLSDSATVSAWLAHPGRAVHADGETIFSWIPKGVMASVGRCRLTLSNPC